MVIMLLLGFASCEKGSTAIETTPLISEKEIYIEALIINNIPGNGPSYPYSINNYLLQKADEMDLEAKIDEFGNVIIEKPASDGAEDKKPTVLVAPTFSSLQSNSYEIELGEDVLGSKEDSILSERTLAIATILSILNSRNDSGKLKAVFICGSNSSYSESTMLSEILDEATYLIGFYGEDGNAIYNESTSYRLLTSQKEIVTEAPKSKYAYVIAASGFPKDASSKITPLAEISDILTLAKTGGLYFELASIEANSSPLVPPSEAAAIILLDDYEKERFIPLFEKSAKEYLNSLPAEYSAVSLQLIETKVPNAVLADEETDRVVTYLYGLFNNGNIPEDSDTLPICINKISLANNLFSCTSTVIGEKEVIDQIVEAQTSISEFTGIPIEETRDIVGFYTDPESEFVVSVKESMQKYVKGNIPVDAILEANVLGTILERHPHLEVLSMGWNVKNDDLYNEYVEFKDIPIPANTVNNFHASVNKNL